MRCTHCGGTGVKPGQNSLVICKKCKGSGKEEMRQVLISDRSLRRYE